MKPKYMLNRLRNTTRTAKMNFE